MKLKFNKIFSRNFFEKIFFLKNIYKLKKEYRNIINK